MGEVEKVRGEGKRPGAVPQQGREADREEELRRGERIKGEGGGNGGREKIMETMDEREGGGREHTPFSFSVR